MDEALLKLLLQQQTEFLSEQNAATHEKIDNLAAVVKSHVEKDEKVWAKVHLHDGALAVLKHSLFWVGSVCMGAVGAIAGWIVLEK